MLARVPVILIGIPAVYGLLVAAGDLVRLVFLAVIALIGQFELSAMLDRGSTQKPVLEWVCGLLILTATHFYGEKGLLSAFSVAVILLMLFTVFQGLQGNGIQRFCHSLFSLFYLPFCLGFFLLTAKSSGGQTLFVILASIWALDIGAYVFGMSIRGPRLAPRISPNKTISGAVGGAVSCVAFMLAASHFQLLAMSGPQLWGLALLTATIGQMADLFESVLKRESEVKDSGAMLGAHGGVLDRIDSILFLGPVCYALLTI